MKKLQSLTAVVKKEQYEWMEQYIYPNKKSAFIRDAVDAYIDVCKKNGCKRIIKFLPPKKEKPMILIEELK